jgi:hypothetical protein
MKISDRFTDYGLIGGLFWFLQILTPLLMLGDVRGETIRTILGPLNAISTPLVSILGAIGLIIVFTTGLLLDILGSAMFRLLEVRVFVNYTRQHINWLKRLLDLNTAYVQDDLSLLLTVPTPWLKPIGLRKEQIFKKAYLRLSSFLLSYVQLAPGVDKVETLVAQISFLNTARTIATTFLISAFTSFTLFANQMRGQHTLLTSIRFVQFQLIQIFSFLAAFMVTTGAYARFCSTLFSMVYVISERDSKTQPTSIRDQPV